MIVSADVCTHVRAYHAHRTVGKVVAVAGVVGGVTSQSAAAAGRSRAQHVTAAADAVGRMPWEGKVGVPASASTTGPPATVWPSPRGPEAGEGVGAEVTTIAGALVSREAPAPCFAMSSVYLVLALLHWTSF